MSKLDDILLDVANTVSEEWCPEDHLWDSASIVAWHMSDEKQRIKSLILELIGPGESLTEEQTAGGRIYKLGDPQGDAVDRYKDGLRKKVEEL